MLVISPNQSASSPWWWAANIGSLLACWGWYELYSRVIFRNREIKPVPIAWVALFGVSLGAIKGAVTGALAAAFGLVPDLVSAVISRVVATSFLGLFVVVALSLLGATLNRFQSERNLLIAERVQQKLKPGSEELDSQDLRDFVTKTKTRLEAQALQPSSLAGQQAVYATLIRDIVETGLRPLSQRLWQREDAKVANFSFADLTRVALLGRGVAVVSVSILYFFASIFTLLAYLPFEVAALRAGLGAVIVAAVLLASRMFSPQKLVAALVYFLAVNLIAALGLTIIGNLVLGEIEGIDSFSIGLVALIWLLETSFIARFLFAAMHNHEDVREQLEALLSAAGIDVAANQAQILLVNRNLANYLHGSVQNRLLSAALRIENGSGDAVNLVAELAAIEKLLDGAATDFDTGSERSLDDQFAEMVGRWEGYVQIEVLPSPLPDFGAEINAKVIQLATEAISNAVRHGLASALTIEVRPQPNSILRITITDDGLGPRKGASGLGSHLFNSLCGANWSLRLRTEGGSILELNVH
jgi:signal transduction histidine kinase